MTTTRTFVLLAAFLVTGFLASLWWQRDTGLADNSDFFRSDCIFTSGPVGLPPGQYSAGSAAWPRRYFNYWLPRWNLHFEVHRPLSSAVLLWVPGVLASAAGVSGGKMDLRVISLFSKLLLLGELCFIIGWSWQQKAHRFLLLITLAAPVALVFSTTDYLAYLQSFYQESASLVFVLPLLFSLVYFRRNPSADRLAVALVCLGLFTTAKRSNFYWPLLALPFLLSRWLAARPKNRQMPLDRRKAASIGLAGAIVCSLVSLRALSFGVDHINAYNSFFYGALLFSDRPAEHLERCGLQFAADCVGSQSPLPVGQRLLSEHPELVTTRNALVTYLREPLAAWRAAGHVCQNMQDISLEYLGKYAANDARAHPLTSPAERSSEARIWITDPHLELCNVWSSVKFHWFPTGGTFVFCLAVFAGWFAWNLRAPERTMQEIAAVGLIVTVGCAIDMAVAILGDGCNELIKHLLLANLLFDLAAVAFVAGVAVRAQARWGGGRASVNLKEHEIYGAPVTSPPA